MIQMLKKLDKLNRIKKDENDALDAIIASKEERMDYLESEEEKNALQEEINELDIKVWENFHEVKLLEDKIFKKYIEVLEDEEDKETIRKSMSNQVRRNRIITRLMKTFIWEKAGRIYTTC